MRAVIDWLSIVLLAVLAVMSAWLAWLQLADSADYGSTAPTPWATPLVWPQSVWLGALALFALVALAFAFDATRLLAGRRTDELARRYGPKATDEEIREEPRRSRAALARHSEKGAEAPGKKSMGAGTVGLGFALVGALLLLGLPVAVVMAGLGVGAGLFTSGAAFVTSMGSVLWGVQNDNMMTAIPLFILLGEILLRSGLADGMYVALAAWLGRLPGGLVHTNIGASALFAATCGSSVATAATIGTVALPNLERRGYDRRQALGSLAAGGTLGILIPPSIAMLVYGSLTNNSIGQLFIAGIVPGILLTLAFMAIIVVQNRFRRAATAEARVPLSECIRLSGGLFPPFVIFGFVMGSLYLGWATPTESAAVGVAIALLLARSHGRLDFAVLHQSFRHTAVLTGMIVLIICGAFILNVTLSMLGIPQIMTKWVTEARPHADRAHLHPHRLLSDPRLLPRSALDAGDDHPGRLSDRDRRRRRPDLVRDLHRAHERDRDDHAAGRHEPLRRPVDPEGRRQDRRRDLGRHALRRRDARLHRPSLVLAGPRALASAGVQ